MLKKILIVSIITLVLLLSGCVETVPESDLPKISNSFEGRMITFNNEVENFTIITKYSTTYNTTQWRITDSKMIFMEAYLAKDIDATVLVEHVHVDVSIKSTKASYDGWTQDTMDDSIHGSTQSGFWITHKYHYENVFAIEGLTEQVLKGYMIGIYGYASGGWGTVTITENDFKTYGGVYAEKFQVVYDVLVKNPGEELYHTHSFMNEFLVPLGESS